MGLGVRVKLVVTLIFPGPIAVVWVTPGDDGAYYSTKDGSEDSRTNGFS
jgi:hypothetical protein